MDVQRLDELLQFARVMLETQIKMQGMIASGNHTEDDFLKLLDDVGHNSYPYYRG